MSPLRNLTSVILVLVTWTAFAQKKDSVSTRERYMPTGVRFSTDAISIARNFYDDSFEGWEVNADVDFYRYYFVVDYGTWSRMYPGDSVDYKNNGRYFRIGADVNFLTRDPERNQFFLGLRYGRGSFDERFSVIDVDDRWGTFTGQYRNDNVSARWFELTTGIKVRMFSWFWMGYTARFKFGLKTGDTPTMLPHDVPGYGRTDRDSYWGFNYQLMFRIPLRKYPPLPPPKKKSKSKQTQDKPKQDIDDGSYD
jgi:hypothetical protein